MKNIERIRIIISSMNKSEKRGFNIYCTTQTGDKGYLKLYDIIENLSKGKREQIEDEFSNSSKNKNLEIAAGYLYNQLLDFLVFKRSKKGIQAQIFNKIERANILFKRKLIEEAFEFLAQAASLASLYESEIMQIIVARTEMYFLSVIGFPSISEKQLIGKQVRLQELLRYSRTISQFHSLRDTLNYRLLHKGLTSFKEKKEGLNDLVLSELSLISNNSISNPQLEKLHLLFQSTYYLETGNYTSAVRNYKQLIDLFGKNFHLTQNPPIYYLNAIEGVLESLLAMGVYSEMHYFLNKLRELNNKENPTDFVLKLLWLDYFYKIIVIIHIGAYEKSNEIQDQFKESLYNKITLLPLDTQLQFHLVNTILFFSQNKFAEAHKMMKNILAEGKIFQQLPLFRVVRLINLMINAEMGDINYIENEVIALKRNLTSRKLSKTEKIVFKFVQSYPLPQYLKSKAILWKNYAKKINQIRGDNYERRYLKYFDFLSFIESKLTNIPLNEVLSNKIVK